MAVDPLSSSAKADLPQSWNRYAYVRNNPLSRIDPTGMSDADAQKALAAIRSGDIQKEFASALQKAGTDSPDPSKSREASGGIGDVVKDGKGSGTYTAFSDVRPGATPTETTVPGPLEVGRRTGGIPVADFHTHQLAGRALPDDFKDAKGPNPDTKDRAAVGDTGLPQLVVSRTQVTMAWEDDAGHIQSAQVMTFSSPAALAAGDVKVVVPKSLEK